MKLNIHKLHWLTVGFISLLSISIWIAFSLPRYQVIDLSVNRQKAISIAEHFLSQKLKLDPHGYHKVAVFSVDSNADRFLQKTLGNVGSKRFIQDNHYDLFYWNIRLFKERQKEEFGVVVSSKTGEVINFSHAFEDTAKRPYVSLELARKSAVEFIHENYPGLSLDQYSEQSQKIEKKENRVDYSFTWEVKNVAIPWDSHYGGGKAQLQMTIGVSGDDILYFNKSQLSIPEGFRRYIGHLKQTGESLMLVSRLFYLCLLTMAIMLLVNRKRFVVPQVVRRFYLIMGGFLLFFILLDILNGFQHLIYTYPTQDSYGEYILKNLLTASVNVIFTALVFILPALTGESLRYEVNQEDKKGGLLSPILSSFFTVPVASQIWLGYLFAPIFLAIQSLTFQLGYKYFGVWDEMSWLTQVSVSIVPALTAFVFGFQASVSEEIMFRLFAINLCRRYGLGIAMAVFLSAFMWGLGHTGYEIFPMWFRGVEVTLLGIVFGLVYLRFGLITVIVAHFLMDSFRYSLQFIINPQMSWDFLTCAMVLSIPLIFSFFAYFLNRSSHEKTFKQKFTHQQEFNCTLLKLICSLKAPEDLPAFKAELIKHGWDPVIIERAFEEK